MRESYAQAWISALRLFAEWFADLYDDFHNTLGLEEDDSTE